MPPSGHSQAASGTSEVTVCCALQSECTSGVNSGVNSRLAVCWLQLYTHDAGPLMAHFFRGPPGLTSWITAILSLSSHFLGSVDSTRPLKATNMGKSRSNFRASAAQQKQQTAAAQLAHSHAGHAYQCKNLHITGLNPRCPVSPDRLSSTYAWDTRLASSLQCCAARYNQPPATTHNAPGSDKYACNSSRSRLVIATVRGRIHKLRTKWRWHVHTLIMARYIN